jgi:hypothetical protein
LVLKRRIVVLHCECVFLLLFFVLERRSGTPSGVKDCKGIKFTVRAKVKLEVVALGKKKPGEGFGPPTVNLLRERWMRTLVLW